MIDFEAFLDHYAKLKGASDDTVKAYRSDLGFFVRFLEAQSIGKISQVNHSVLASFIEAMKATPGRGGKTGLADATIKRRLAAVSSFFDYKRATTNPKLHNPVVDFHLRYQRNNRPKPVDREVIEKLLSTVTSPRDHLLIILFLATGLRLSEMASLNRDTIVITEKSGGPTGEVLVLGVGQVVGKGNKRREFLVNLKAMISLELYKRRRTDEDPALFLSERKQRMSTRAMQERMTYWCKVADLPNINLHRFRHTFATSMANAGMDVMLLRELMGHSSIATTLQYTKIADTTLAHGYHAAMELAGS